MPLDIVNPQTGPSIAALAGLTYYCQFITRGPAGNITDLEVTVLNLDKLETSGLELAADYTVPLSVYSVVLPVFSSLSRFSTVTSRSVMLLRDRA